jgi:tetratricopeptide (TPR) repeat protein
MNIVAHALGFFYHIKGLTNRVEDPLNAQRFYEIAIEKFEEALDSNPNNKEVHKQYKHHIFVHDR